LHSKLQHQGILWAGCDIIQYCRDYIHNLDALKDKYDLITRDQREFLKSDEQTLTKYSDCFFVFMRKCDGFKQVIVQFKHLFASTEQMLDEKGNSVTRAILRQDLERINRC
jgi:hypothetical protein